MNRQIRICDLKITDLKTELQKRGISSIGKKCVLIEKLKTALNTSFLGKEDTIDNTELNDTISSDGSEITVVDFHGQAKQSKRSKSFFKLFNKVKDLEIKLNRLEIMNTKLKRFIRRKLDFQNIKTASGKIGSIVPQITNIIQSSMDADMKNVSDQTYNATDSSRGLPTNNEINKYIEKEINYTELENQAPTESNGLESRSHSEIENIAEIQPKKKIVILGDSHGRNCSKVLIELLNCSKFEIQTIFKPNAAYEYVVSDIENLTRDLSMQDFVIIMAGTNDIIRKRTVSNELIERTVNSLSHTNAIFVTVPFMNIKENLNDRIYFHNYRLYEYLRTIDRPNLNFLDVNEYISENEKHSDGIHLNRKGKVKLLAHISEYIVECCDYFENKCERLLKINLDQSSKIEVMNRNNGHRQNFVNVDNFINVDIINSCFLGNQQTYVNQK